MRRHVPLLCVVAAIVALHGLAVVAVWWIDRDHGRDHGDHGDRGSAGPAGAGPALPPLDGQRPRRAPPPMPPPYRAGPGPVDGEDVEPAPDPAVVEAAPEWSPVSDAGPASAAEAEALERRQAEARELTQRPPPARPVPRTER